MKNSLSTIRGLASTRLSTLYPETPIMNASTKHSPAATQDGMNPTTWIPRATHARWFLQGLEADSPFMNALREALPDEEARLAYLNHWAWQARS